MQHFVAQLVERQSRNWSVMGAMPSKAPIVSLRKKLYLYHLVLVGFSNTFKCDLHKQNCLLHNQTEINEYKLNTILAGFCNDVFLPVCYIDNISETDVMFLFHFTGKIQTS